MRDRERLNGCGPAICKIATTALPAAYCHLRLEEKRCYHLLSLERLVGCWTRGNSRIGKLRTSWESVAAQSAPSPVAAALFTVENLGRRGRRSAVGILRPNAAEDAERQSLSHAYSVAHESTKRVISPCQFVGPVAGSARLPSKQTNGKALFLNRQGRQERQEKPGAACSLRITAWRSWRPWRPWRFILFL